eukprot:CAMPEP_0194588192 /NCGR_PEP_ID=MMETSP0292-20121207/19609_1 /TAXON_ID=39354 /ORGANISM="Heterosigma akashiwo, Strain CCMP2393" /LENGTH=329 /DNA_ID=CAMNT_0039444599 /DNA_START=149 /DNA_END=1138 /DNA_ORIENTATION=-
MTQAFQAPVVGHGAPVRQGGMQLLATAEQDPSPSTPKKCVNRGKRDLLALSSLTSRGQTETQIQKGQIYSLIEQLEKANPTDRPAYSEKLNGEWLLCYTSDDPSRSSPFFWAFRKALKKLRNPLDDERKVSEEIFSITDSIPIKSVGQAKWIIKDATSDGVDGSVVSQVQIVAGRNAKSGLFPAFKTKMTTTSKMTPYSDDVSMITIEKTEALDADIDKFLPIKLSTIAFPSGSVIERLWQQGDKPAHHNPSKVRMRTTYLDDTLRIARNRAGHVFVFVRGEADGTLASAAAAAAAEAAATTQAAKEDPLLGGPATEAEEDTGAPGASS